MGIAWSCGGRTLEWGSRAAVMGVLNVTPDSFSDGGRFLDTDEAIRRGLDMAAQGAAIIDIGGESSRPGAEPVSVNDELRRVLPVVEALAGGTECLVSIDTTKAEVARQAIAAGAHIINDISAMTADPAMVAVAAASRAGVVLMHMQGTPRTMQEAPSYRDVVGEVTAYLRDRAEALLAAGISRDAIAVDPGIGFGKTVDHNVALLRGLPALRAVGFPVAVGVSRKSFLGKLTGRDVGQRLAASLAAMAYAVLNGADIVRVHDVVESCDAVRVLAMLRQKA
jgi:dihydropteroate synthase